MPGEITLNDLIELEAYAESLRNKAQQLREKMQKDNVKKIKRGITPAMIAQADAQLLRTQMRAKARLEANKKATS